MNNECEEYHRTRSCIDFNFIKNVFERDERQKLEELQSKLPNHIIRMPNSDLIAMGYIEGIGGSVPAEWNGLVHQS